MSAYVAEVVSAIHQGVQVPEEDLNNLQTILDFLNGLDVTGTGAHIREGIAQDVYKRQDKTHSNFRIPGIDSLCERELAHPEDVLFRESLTERRCSFSGVP